MDSSRPTQTHTAAALRRLPADQRDAILSAAAALAESDYRADPALTAFEVFGRDDLADLRQQIEAFTVELFGQVPTITEECDPEIDRSYIVFTVRSDAEVPEIVRLNDLWHRRMLQVAGSAANFFCLSLDIR